MAETQRQMTGAVVRADKVWLEKLGILEAVRARLPADSLAILDKPPLHMHWIPARHIDDVLEAVVALVGEEKMLQFAQDVTSSSLGPVVRPLLKTVMSLFGASPGALFAKLDSIVPLFVRGASFSFEPDGTNAGTLRMRTVDKPAPAWLLQWKGTLRFGFEVTQAAGNIHSCIIDGDGKGASYHLSWS